MNHKQNTMNYNKKQKSRQNDSAADLTLIEIREGGKLQTLVFDDPYDVIILYIKKLKADPNITDISILENPMGYDFGCLGDEAHIL